MLGKDSAGAFGGSQDSKLSSGYNPQKMEGVNGLRQTFTQALTLRPEDANQATLEAVTVKAGELRGQADLLRRVSEQKLQAADATAQVYDIAWQHALSAAGKEVQWRQKTAQNMRSMSGKLLDLGVVEAQHAGYCKYIDVADRTLSF